MEFSTPVGGSNNTLTNSTEGDEELSVGEVVIQEQEGLRCFVTLSIWKIPGDEITDLIRLMSKDELELRHKLPDHSGISEEEIPVI
ncbi:hypothetical protein AHAS_Ahas16G0192100 [Arachis hypogaea]